MVDEAKATETQETEFHDGTVDRIHSAGTAAIVEMTLYVHGTQMLAGWERKGWYQPAQMKIAGATFEQRPAGVVRSWSIV